MTERPILFSGPMVQAILRDPGAVSPPKTQTRRVVTPQTSSVLGEGYSSKSAAWAGLKFDHPRCRERRTSTLMDAVVGRDKAPLDVHLDVPWIHPEDEAAGRTWENDQVLYRVRPRIEVGDLLWVRETHMILEGLPGSPWPDLPHRSASGGRIVHYREGFDRSPPAGAPPSTCPSGRPDSGSASPTSERSGSTTSPRTTSSPKASRCPWCRSGPAFRGPTSPTSTPRGSSGGTTSTRPGGSAGTRTPGRGRSRVAQHSVLVSHLVPPEHAFEGLMHDSPEFGVGDVVSPLKRQLAGFSLIEARVWRAIAEKYRLPFDGYGMVVELWDLAMCRAEAEVLLPHRLEWVDKLPDKPEATKALRDTGIWDWRMAKDQFLRRFRELQEARAA